MLRALLVFALVGCGLNPEKLNYRRSSKDRQADGKEIERSQVFAKKDPYHGTEAEVFAQDWFNFGPDDKSSDKKESIHGANVKRAFYSYELVNAPTEPIIVAVIDGGLDVNHEDLKDHIWQNSGEVPHDNQDNDQNGFVDDVHGWNFLSKNSDVSGLGADHGTHVAGIIAALRNNNLGINGIASNAKIMMLKAVPFQGDETDEDVADAIHYAIKMGAKLINMSFGKYQSPGYFLVNEALRLAAAKGLLIVQSAGNDAKSLDDVTIYPARKLIDDKKTIDSWIMVGASGPSQQTLLADFSNFGKNSVDLFAPGTDIRSTVPDNRYESQSGTSMSAPVISGIAVALWSYQPSLTAAEIKSILMKSVRKYPDVSTAKTKISELSISGGVVDLFNALEEIYKPR